MPLHSEVRDLWFFGYGSLMWEPGFPYVERHWARLRGWHRRFSLLSTQSWGSPERPGLCLALHWGGSVAGVAFRVAPEHADGALHYLDQRESAYLRTSVTLDLDAGEQVSALTYVHDPKHPRSVPDLPVDEIVRLVRQGQGYKGRSLDYLANTVASLTDRGAKNGDMHRLLARVQAAG